MSTLTQELHKVSQELEKSRSSLDDIDKKLTQREKILKDSRIILMADNSSDESVVLSRNFCFYTSNLLLLITAVILLLYILTGMVEDKPSILVL